MSDEPSDGRDRLEGWAGVIRSVRSPLGLLALVVLVLQAILGGLALTASEDDRRLFFILLVVVLLVAVVSVAAFPSRFVSPAQKKLQKYADILPQKPRYDIFVSSPLAALSDDQERLAYQGKLREVRRSLQKCCGFESIFLVAETISVQKEFEAPDVAIRKNLTAIRDSQHFVLIYMEEAPSSSLVEAGMALALRKPSVFFVADRDRLPFLLRMAGQASEGGAGDLPRVRVYEAQDLEGVVELITVNGKALFT